MKDNYATEEYKGIAIHSWGDYMEMDLRYRLCPPHVDIIGRAIPVAVSDGYLYIGSNVEYIKSMINTSRNESSSLADIPEYVLVAQGMNDLGAIGAMIVDDVLYRDILTSAGVNSPPFKNISAIGVGPGKDDNAIYVALVIVFDNSEFAEEGATLLEQTIEVYIELNKKYPNQKNVMIYDTGISVDDKVLLAKIYTDDEILWRRWILNEWPLIDTLITR